jgi:hypothetical protein
LDHLPLILVEVLLIFGGALAFGWWQLRDLKRERVKREAKQRALAANDPAAPTAAAANQGSREA